MQVFYFLKNFLNLMIGARTNAGLYIIKSNSALETLLYVSDDEVEENRVNSHSETGKPELSRASRNRGRHESQYPIKFNSTSVVNRNGVVSWVC